MCSAEAGGSFTDYTRTAWSASNYANPYVLFARMGRATLKSAGPDVNKDEMKANFRFEKEQMIAEKDKVRDFAGLGPSKAQMPDLSTGQPQKYNTGGTQTNQSRQSVSRQQGLGIASTMLSRRRTANQANATLSAPTTGKLTLGE